MPPGDQQKFTCLVVTSTASARLKFHQRVSLTSSLRSQASALSMSSFLPPSAALQPSLRHSVLPGLHALCPAVLQSSKVEFLQEKSRSLVRTTSIMFSILDFIPRDPLRRLASLSAVAQIQAHLLSRDDPLKIWGLMRNSLSLSLFRSHSCLHPPNPFCCLFSCLVSQTLHPSSLVSRHHWGLNVMESGLTSVRCPDSWPADVYYVCGLFIGHTQTLTIGMGVVAMETTLARL